jgi:hypothetical protein
LSDSAFILGLDVWKDELLRPILSAGRLSLDGGEVADPKALLQVALVNEVNVSELAAAWMPTTKEIDVKIAFGRQVGDEAGHFQLVAERLAALGVDTGGFQPPGGSPIFDYLRSLSGTVERIAAGLFTLESMALGVNENFMALCAHQGDLETVGIYRGIIQPDEARHQRLGRDLLARYVVDGASEARARETVGTLLEIAARVRARAAERLGTACIPGC